MKVYLRFPVSSVRYLIFDSLYCSQKIYTRSRIRLCYIRNVVKGVITFPKNLLTSGLSILLHGVISVPGATSYDDDDIYLNGNILRKTIEGY